MPAIASAPAALWPNLRFRQTQPYSPTSSRVIALGVALTVIVSLLTATGASPANSAAALIRLIDRVTGVQASGHVTTGGAPIADAELSATNALGQNMKLTLPGRATTQVSDGVTTVYPSSGEGYTVAGQNLGNGDMRGLVTITSSAAPTSFAFRLVLPSGVTAQLEQNGGVSLTNASHSLVGVISPPWAKDATGRMVPTHYGLSGNVLTQTVEHHRAVYPVVADPAVHWNWWGFSVLFSRWETQVISWGIGAVGAYFGWTGWAAVAAIAALPVAQWAISHGYCLAINRDWAGSVWPWVYRC